jgi:hypothetical protein
MSQCVVVCHDEGLKATFHVTLPMLNRFAYGQSFQIVRIVGVAALSWTLLMRPIRDSSSLECCSLHGRSICTSGERRVRADLRKDQAWRGRSINLRVSKAPKHACVSVTFCGMDFRNNSVNRTKMRAPFCVVGTYKCATASTSFVEREFNLPTHCSPSTQFLEDRRGIS